MQSVKEDYRNVRMSYEEYALDETETSASVIRWYDCSPFKVVQNDRLYQQLCLNITEDLDTTNSVHVRSRTEKITPNQQPRSCPPGDQMARSQLQSRRVTPEEANS